MTRQVSERSFRVTPGVQREFYSQVISALPALTDSEMKEWSSKSKELQSILYEALKLDKPTIIALEIRVDDSRQFSEMLQSSKQDFVDPEIIEGNFPIREKKKKRSKVFLVRFNRTLSPDDALAELKKHGFEPGGIEELFAVGGQHPERQLESPIVALGSIWKDKHGCRFIPHLWKNEKNERVLGIVWFDDDELAKHYSFLAIQIPQRK